MNLKKRQMLWYVNLGLFGSSTLLFITGLINWLILPRGSETTNTVLVTIRHLIRDTHEWCGLFFMLLVFLHIYLHKDYVVANFKKMF